MKKRPLSSKTLTRLTSVDSLTPLFIGFLLFAVALIFGSCSNDDEPDFTADIAKVVGTYNVADKDEDSEVENYSVTITKSGNGVEISNFGDIMYVPVKATIMRDTFTIPSQTFKGNTMTIVIYGQGTLNGNKLTFDYTIKTDDDYFLKHSCDATKLQ